MEAPGGQPTPPPGDDDERSDANDEGDGDRDPEGVQRGGSQAFEVTDEFHAREDARAG
jgi:hypothetical protein